MHYLEFVNAVTSQRRRKTMRHSFIVFKNSKGKDFHAERLLTAAVGMSAEAGEFTEIVKKMVFQANLSTKIIYFT